MSNQRVCCCDEPTGVPWIVGELCGGGFGDSPFPVVRSSVVEALACLEGSHVRLYNGQCYIFDVLGEQTSIEGEPSGLFANAEATPYYCNCWLCEQDIDPVDPTPGNPDDGPPNCCPSDTGCTTFGANTVNARIVVSGRVFVRTRCGNNPPYTFIENEYEFEESFDATGSSCQVSGGGSVDKPSEDWARCVSPAPTQPRVSGAASWSSSNGMTSFSGIIGKMPNMPGDAQGNNFRLRALGGDSNLVGLSAAFGNYDVEEYRFDEAVFGDCMASGAASGRIVLSLNGDVNYVECDMVVRVAIDNLGECP